jgi:hypothetical protein
MSGFLFDNKFLLYCAHRNRTILNFFARDRKEYYGVFETRRIFNKKMLFLSLNLDKS